MHKRCGEPNAFYEPDEGRIVLCYEMMLKVAQVAASDPTASEDEIGSHFVGAWLFIFFHELGHALIDLYDLPITGKEEDAVDDFSSVLLIESGLDELALEAAGFWAALDMGDYSQLDRAQPAARPSTSASWTRGAPCSSPGASRTAFTLTGRRAQRAALGS